MMITVYFTSQLKMAVGKSSESFELEDGATMNGLLDRLADKHGEAFRKLVFDAEGRLQPSLLLCRGDDQVERDDDVPLADGDSVTLLAAISGG